VAADAWRTRLAWVPQSPTIFSGSIADNVRLGDPAADDDRVRQALIAARATDFVDALPHGVATVLGEGGHRLSGGQRQRLAIARAWLRDAPVVILDEFTAHLDTGTERSVLDATRDLLRGRTAILIAHRLATARLADRIIVLDAGRIVGDGTHDSLLDECPTYRALAAHHSGGMFADRSVARGATA
jgi:ABC-type multidrug transport system fused ATPase/permease subunit